MSEEYFSAKNEKIDFKSIVLTHFKAVLDLSRTEFRGGYWQTINRGSYSDDVYVPDSRKQFCQAVEVLALALYPHFDEKMKISYIDYRKKQKNLFSKFSDGEGFFDSDEFSQGKYSFLHLNLCKRLFRELSCLLHRLDYLGSAIYSEKDLVDLDDDDDEEKLNLSEGEESGS
jgi:hypothetical protein